MTEPVKNFYKRNLPHWHPPGRSIFLTWRLHGSLPQKVINQLKMTREHLRPKSELTPSRSAESRILEFKKMFARVDAILDKAETGPLWLKNVSVADMVQKALLERYAHLYTLWAYVLMANHLHAFLRPKSLEVSLATITKSLKGYTAFQANRLLKRTGQKFWQDESFDHWSRDQRNLFGLLITLKIILLRQDW